MQAHTRIPGPNRAESEHTYTRASVVCYLQTVQCLRPSSGARAGRASPRPPRLTCWRPCTRSTAATPHSPPAPAAARPRCQHTDTTHDTRMQREERAFSRPLRTASVVARLGFRRCKDLVDVCVRDWGGGPEIWAGRLVILGCRRVL
eukprot:2755293-Rhodomonas_salina.4